MFWLWLFLGLLAGLAAVLLCSPVVSTVDTRRAELGVRWTALFRARYPLPGRTGSAQLYLAGFPVPFPRRERGDKKPRKEKPRREGARLPRIFRFLLYCAADAHLRRALIVRGGKLARGSLHSFELSQWNAAVSLPDPALNGMLFGWLAATGWKGSRRVAVNFLGRNWLDLEVRFYPYRMVLAFAAFLIRLPHRSIIGHWLESKG